ncbi:MAG: hypothetical protein NTW08_05440 [Gammaproteobacteria bacterium]|nr:hypothetical protein [Gammaproteobacteria bacterium]
MPPPPSTHDLIPVHCTISSNKNLADLAVPYGNSVQKLLDRNQLLLKAVMMHNGLSGEYAIDENMVDEYFAQENAISPSDLYVFDIEELYSTNNTLEPKRSQPRPVIPVNNATHETPTDPQLIKHIQLITVYVHAKQRQKLENLGNHTKDYYVNLIKEHLTGLPKGYPAILDDAYICAIQLTRIQHAQAKPLLFAREFQNHYLTQLKRKMPEHPNLTPFPFNPYPLVANYTIGSLLDFYQIPLNALLMINEESLESLLLQNGVLQSQIRKTMALPDTLRQITLRHTSSESALVANSLFLPVRHPTSQGHPSPPRPN